MTRSDKLRDKADNDLDKLSSTIDKFLLHIRDLEEQIGTLNWKTAEFSVRVDELVSANEKKKAIIEHLKRQKEDLLKEIKSLRKNK